MGLRIGVGVSAPASFTPLNRKPSNVNLMTKALITNLKLKEQILLEYSKDNSTYNIGKANRYSSVLLIGRTGLSVFCSVAIGIIGRILDLCIGI